MSLIDVLIGVALLLIVFYGLFGAFRLSILLIGTNKAKVGAIALANERMEQIRSYPYAEVGTDGGIPSGDFAQEETIELNQTTYTRRTFITYVDDPADGEGAMDENGIPADYKKVKVELLWSIKDRAQSYSTVSNVVPLGVESTAGGGTLRIEVFDANADPVSSAEVRVENSTLSPAVDVTTFTNTDGIVLFPGGAPEGSDYHITVTKPSYSTDGTYNASAENPNPNPPNLTVEEGVTTTGSFSIDLLSSITINTFTKQATSTFTDSFSDESKVSLLASTTVAAGSVRLSISGSTYESEGEVHSNTVSPSELALWGELIWSDSAPTDTAVAYRLYYNNGSDFVPIPDTDLPGNSAGFTSSPVALGALSTTTYSGVRIVGALSTSVPGDTPRIEEWTLSYLAGPTPLPDIPFTLRGTKTIGTDSDDAPIYAFSTSTQTSSEGSVFLESLAWDSYPLIIDGSSGGYDIASACPPLPLSLLPNTALIADLYMVPHTTHSLRVLVTDSAGALLPDSSVTLSEGGDDTLLETGECGQVHFEGLSNSDSYTVTAEKTGYESTELTEVNVTGADTITIALPLDV